MLIRISLLVLCLLAVVKLSAQPTICEPPIEMEPFCDRACLICDIDGYEGRHDSNVRGDAPPDFCVFGVENAQWIAFLAGSERLVVDVAVSNCENSFLFSGLQMSIYESNDCETFERVSNCIGGIFQVRDGQTGRLTMNDLTVGQYYYLVMDGARGDNCDWTMTVADGTTEVQPLDSTGVILVEESYCVNDTIRVGLQPEVGVAQVLWQVDGDTVTTEQSWDTTFTVGPHVICVTGSNACNIGPTVCDTITVLPLVRDTIMQQICPAECSTVGDSLLCDVGAFDITVSAIMDGCDTLRRVILTAAPPIEVTVDTAICADQCIMLFDTTICDTGTYDFLRPGSGGGCDSSVLLQVRQASNVLVTIQDTICAGTCFEVTDTVLCEPGLWQFTRPASQGCDTIYTVALDVADTTLSAIDTMLCPGESLILDGTTLAPPRIYTQIRTGTNGCDSTVVWTIGERPLDTIMETYEICQGDTLLLDGIAIDSSGRFTTTRPGERCDAIVLADVTVRNTDTISVVETLCVGDTLTIGDSVFTQAGEYDLSLLTPEGCDSVVQLRIVSQLLPIVRLAPETLCEGDTFRIEGLILAETASDTIVYQRSGTCDSLVLYDVTFVDCDLIVQTTESGVTCAQPESGRLEVAVMNGLRPWILTLLQGPDRLEEVLLTSTDRHLFEGLPSGEYQILVSDQLGNMESRSLVIEEPDPIIATIATSDFNGFDVSCEGAVDGAIEVDVMQANGAASVRINGVEIDSENTGLDTGWYQIVVEDSLLCRLDTSIRLDAPALPQLMLAADLYPCSLDTAALLTWTIDSELGVESILIGEEEVTSMPILVEQDEQGSWVLEVVDANGCAVTDTITIMVDAPIGLSIPDQVQLAEGDSIDVLAASEALIASATWMGIGLSCRSCLQPRVSAIADGTVATVLVTTIDGCVQQYAVVLAVDEIPPLTLANIFSPNGDGINDEWIATHPAMQQLQSVTVFDRWGNKVFEATPDGSRPISWNGQYRGTDVSPGVYVYTVRYVSVRSGQIETKSGTITVAR